MERHGERVFLKVSVTAPPEDGKANAALLSAIAEWLELPKSKVSLEAGQKSRIKSVFVPVDLELLRRRFSQMAPSRAEEH